MENLSASGMERHQIMMNNEFMKHFRIMNRASVREIMLQHERTFKEQVHDLHKLYEVQRLLMEKAKGNGQPLSTQVGAFPEAPRQSKQQATDFWEPHPSGSERVVSGGQSASTGQDKSKSSNSTVRKRKIDLEQLPADDSDDDDEMGSTIDAFNPITSKEVTQGHRGHTNTVTSSLGSMDGSGGLHAFQPLKGAHINTTRIQNSGDGGNPKLLEIYSDQSPNQVGAKSPPFHIGNVLNCKGFDAGRSNRSMPFPQPDPTNWISNGVGREAPWVPQSSNAQVQNVGLHSITVSSQPPRQHTHLPAPLLPFEKSHEQNGIFKGSPALDLQHGNKNCAPLESLLGLNVPAADSKQSIGLQVSPEPPKVWSFTSPKKPIDIPEWYANGSFPNGTQLGSIVAPLAITETRPAGGQAMGSFMAPALASASIKGRPHQEHDSTIVWSPQKYAQLPQQTSLSPQALHQAIWLPSSQNSQSSLYSQEIVYAGHPSDVSHVGYLTEALPKNHGYLSEALSKNQSDAPGPWTMTGPGHHYYSSAGPVSQQRPPFKKPPKLVLKNDGAGMELRLASPEGEDLSEKTKLLASREEHSEKSCQRRLPLNSIKYSPPSSSECQDGKPDAKREFGKEQKQVEVAKSSGIQGPISDIKPSMIFDGLCVSMSAASLGQQENVRPWTPTTPDNHVPQILINSSALLTFSAPQPNVTEAPSQETNVSRRKDLDSYKKHEELVDTDAPSSADWDALTKCHSLAAMKNNLSFMKGDAVDESNNAPSSTGRDAPTKGGLHGHSLQAMENNSSFTKGDIVGRLTSHGGEHTSVPSRSTKPLLAAASSFTPEGANAAMSHASAPQENEFDRSQTGLEPCEKRAQGSDANLCEEDKPRKGSHASELTPLKKDDPLIKNISHQRTLLGHGSEMSPPRQLVLPAASTQSTSSGTSGFQKQERKTCSITGSENGTSHIRASEKSSSGHQSRTATPTYHRDCLSFMSESKPDMREGDKVPSDSSEDFPQEDSDSDNLAATILLSFAPKAEMQQIEKKLAKDNVSSSSGGSRKRRLADRLSLSRTRPSTDGGPTVVGVQSEASKKAKDGQRPLILVPKKVEPLVKPKMNERLREERSSVEPRARADKKGDKPRKSGALTLPKVVAMGSLTDEALPMWKSKQLNKIDGGAMVSSKSANAADHTKSKPDVLHARTGRRSSRGPSPSVRAHHPGRTPQRLDGGDTNPTLTDRHSRSREEEVIARRKLSRST